MVYHQPNSLKFSFYKVFSKHFEMFRIVLKKLGSNIHFFCIFFNTEAFFSCKIFTFVFSFNRLIKHKENDFKLVCQKSKSNCFRYLVSSLLPFLKFPVNKYCDNVQNKCIIKINNQFFIYEEEKTFAFSAALQLL